MKIVKKFCENTEKFYQNFIWIFEKIVGPFEKLKKNCQE